jgi:hypothetical protein
VASIGSRTGCVAVDGLQEVGPRPGLFERLAEEPALLELAFLAVAGLVGGWLFFRLRALARECQERRALSDLVLGLTLAEDRQWAAALVRLDRAREADPSRVSVRLVRALALNAIGRSEEAHAEHLALRRVVGGGHQRNENGLREAHGSATGRDSETQLEGATPACASLGSDLRPVSAAARRPVPEHGDLDRLTLRRIEDPEGLWDAIRAEPEHVQRLCAAPGPHHVEDVAALGVEAAPHVLHAAVEGADPDHLVALVTALGPGIAPVLVEASRSIEPFPGDALRPLLSALGVRAADPLRSQLGSAERRLRHVLIDVHLGMADVEVFERVLDVVPLVDVVQRCNEVPEHVLVPLLAALPEAHFAFEVLLPDGGFVRDAAVLHAIPTARAPRALEALLARRGAARSLCSELVRALVDPELSAVAGRLLDGFGEQALGTLVLAFADPALSDEVRGAVRRRLTASGSRAVEPLCGCFGASPTELDGVVVEVLAEIGDEAVPILRDSCLDRGLRARLRPGGRKRSAHRRAMVVRALGAIGTMQARAALTTLRASESDPEVLLRIGQALHRLDARVTIPRPASPAVSGERVRAVDEEEAEERG